MLALTELLSAMMRRCRGLIRSIGERPGTRKDLGWVRKLDDRTLDDIGMTRDQLASLIGSGRRNGEPDLPKGEG